jgi:four helix bundle protein
METTIEQPVAKSIIRNYRDLRVWEKAMELAVEVHRLTKRLPKKDGDGLVSQLRRAAASIPANIAEGHGRNHLGEYLHHLSIANGSLTELETHLCLAERLETLPAERIQALLQRTAEISRMLAGLSKALRAKKPRP